MTAAGGPPPGIPAEAPDARPALVVGRFQPPHKGHEALIGQACKAHGRVVVAVGSSQEANTHRNPFTYEERVAMLRSLFDDRIRVVAVPDIHDPPNWVAHLERLTGPFGAVYGNDLVTLALFEEAGHAVVSPGLQERERWQARVIRDQMASGDLDWQDAVPAPVVSWLVAHDGPARLCRLENKNER
jgi:nicotinamide-nucleotide adenylyltransferase